MKEFLGFVFKAHFEVRIWWSADDLPVPIAAAAAAAADIDDWCHQPTFSQNIQL